MSGFTLDSARLGRLVARFAPARVQEPLQEFRSLERLLKANGCDWHDLADLLETVELRPRLGSVELLQIAVELRAHVSLTGKELEFVISCANLIGNGYVLTPRQRKWLLDIEAR